MSLEWGGSRKYLSYSDTFLTRKFEDCKENGGVNALWYATGTGACRDAASEIMLYPVAGEQGKDHVMLGDRFPSWKDENSLSSVCLDAGNVRNAYWMAIPEETWYGKKTCQESPSWIELEKSDDFYYMYTWIRGVKYHLTHSKSTGSDGEWEGCEASGTQQAMWIKTASIHDKCGYLHGHNSTKVKLHRVKPVDRYKGVGSWNRFPQAAGQKAAQKKFGENNCDETPLHNMFSRGKTPEFKADDPKPNVGISCPR
jgi:hypothetical protein